MARKEIESADYKMPSSHVDLDATPREDIGRVKLDHPRAKQDESGIIMLDGIEVTAGYLADLAFNEEPIEIVIHPSTHQHSSPFYELWNNGRGAEIFVNGEWQSICFLPVNRPITVRRKIVEQMVRGQVVNVTTWHDTAMVENPRNGINRAPTPVHGFQIRNDPSPRGQEWLAQIMDREARMVARA